MILGLVLSLAEFGAAAGGGIRSHASANHRHRPVAGKSPSCGRKHSAVVTDFGAVGDGKTSNTKAFKAAIEHLAKVASDGGAELIVPPGKWVTGSFNLTSHFTLFLHKDAVILGSTVNSSLSLSLYVTYIYLCMCINKIIYVYVCVYTCIT